MLILHLFNNLWKYEIILCSSRVFNPVGASPKFTLSRVEMVTLNGYSVDEESPLKYQKIVLLEHQVVNLEIAILQA